MKITETKTVFTCDFCGSEVTPQREIYAHRTGFDALSGNACGIMIQAIAYGGMREHSCASCNYEALRNVPDIKAEMDYLNRFKTIARDLLDWYDNGRREMKDLDQIRDAAADLFPGR